MKLTAEIADTEHALDLQRDGARVVAEVDGRRYELEAREVEPGVYLLQAGGRVYECRVRSTDAAAGSCEVTVQQQVFQIRLNDPKRLRHAHGAGATAAGRAAVADALLIVEAMKMQNELKSPKVGVVVELHAEAGATVNAGDVLAVVE